jgi:F0F1-type ATP synthase membrane subunit b/b'
MAETQTLILDIQFKSEDVIKKTAELKNQVATLSIEIAEKILKSELSSDEKQKSLVNTLLKDVNLN